MDVIKLENITKSYSDAYPALKNLKLKISGTYKLGIAGETGSGKSTLLKIIAGLEQPDSGQVWFNGNKVKGPEEKLVPGHRELAYLSQKSELPRFLRVIEILKRESRISESQERKIFSACRITKLLQKNTDHLSGGERQRVSWAIQLLKLPEVLLLDEPFSNQDTIHKEVMREVVNSLTEDLNLPVIWVSHDPLDVLSWAEDILVMRSGKVIQRGTPQKIYYQPKNKYVAELFGYCNFIDGQKWQIPKKNQLCEIKGKILLRPESFLVSSGANPEGREGTVIEKRFFGNIDLLYVLMGDGEVVIVSAKAGKYVMNERVGVDSQIPES